MNCPYCDYDKFNPHEFYKKVLVCEACNGEWNPDDYVSDFEASHLKEFVRVLSALNELRDHYVPNDRTRPEVMLADELLEKYKHLIDKNILDNISCIKY